MHSSLNINLCKAYYDSTVMSFYHKTAIEHAKYAMVVHYRAGQKNRQKRFVQSLISFRFVRPNRSLLLLVHTLWLVNLAGCISLFDLAKLKACLNWNILPSIWTQRWNKYCFELVFSVCTISYKTLFTN